MGSLQILYRLICKCEFAEIALVKKHYWYTVNAPGMKMKNLEKEEREDPSDYSSVPMSFWFHDIELTLQEGK